MTNIDQFESFFNAAHKPQFQSEVLSLKSVLVVTDLDAESSEGFTGTCRQFVESLEDLGQVDWAVLSGDDYGSVDALMKGIQDGPPDLICTYRNLRNPATDYPYSLGTYLDVLTQVVGSPVLVLPRPTAESTAIVPAPSVVMAITDHLTGDGHLVSYAARFTPASGTLYLSHIEDEAILQRYVATFAKIPAIDTKSAAHELQHQLLKEPHDYVIACREVLHESRPSIHVEEIVMLGHQLKDYVRLVEKHDVSLVVLNTKDDDQLAIHGLAYPLAIELRDTAMLLL